MSSYDQVEGIARRLIEQTGQHPLVGIVCGSGLGNIAESIQERVDVEYKDIPDFPVSTVHGHAGKFVFGLLSGKPVVCMQGRFHMYEGYDAAQTAMPIRVMRLMGVQILLITNAAGGINRDFNVGDIMIIKDHIYFPNIAGKSPLVGKNDDRFGPRFPPMSSAYSEDLRILGRKVAENLNLEKYFHEGVYAMCGGPSFETIAELRMFKICGADVVGMSTCPEVVVAVHCGIKVFAISLVTNKCVMDYDDPRSANHEEVIETAKHRSYDVQRYIEELVRELKL